MGLLNKKKTKKEEVAVENTDAKKKTAVKKQAAPKKKSGKLSVNALRILKKPVLSEKTTSQESGGQYTFIVDKDANKIEVKKAIEQVYGVRPAKVNMIWVEGKRKQSGKFTGRRSDYKKAIVSLPKGKRIDIHEGV
ncbi:MAG: 50S ribosomal protein L23 [Candidatus Magasanikbacteria bacterium]|jgi:large subunit ribosomal protein L23|nr:50S ribosomal protein L23 [Candidatus Magasanikbacteria bacterium]MBT4071378.1 50S ribosomal protein L23 [Candidatus Magasanikbacteria bacterium]